MERGLGSGEHFFIPVKDPREVGGNGARKKGGGKGEKVPKPQEPYVLEDIYEKGEEGMEKVADDIAEVMMRLYTNSGTFNPNLPGAGKDFAEIQNELTKYLVHQKSVDAFRNFMSSITHALVKRARVQVKMNADVVEATCKTFVNQFFSDSRLKGVKSEVKYIQRRAQELGIISAKNTVREEVGDTYHRIMTNHLLDASKEVDVIELAFIKNEEGVPARIEELRLVQVKTGTLSPEEVARIHDVHRAFARTCAEYPIEVFDVSKKREEVRTVLSEHIQEALDLMELCILTEGDEGDCVTALKGLSPRDEDAPLLIAHYQKMKAYIESKRQSEGEARWADASARVERVLDRFSQVLEKKSKRERGVSDIPVPVGRVVSVVVHADGTQTDVTDVTGEPGTGLMRGMRYRPPVPPVDKP